MTTQVQVQPRHEVAMLIDDALQLFLTQLEADGRSPHTLGQYRRHILLFASWAHGQRHSDNVEDIGHEIIARFLSSPQARQRSDGRSRAPGTANALRSSLWGFFAYLHKAGYITADPARLVRRARTGVPPPRGLSAEQRDRLLQVLEAGKGDEAHRDRLLFSLILGTGVRLGSAIALDVRDLDLEQGRIVLRRTKGGGADSVYMNLGLVAELRSFVGDRTSGPLFLADGERRISARHVQRRLSQWVEKAGIQGRFSPHSLRHSFAMGLYEKTHDVLLVKEALGHRSISSTLVYARCDRERLRAAVGDL